MSLPPSPASAPALATGLLAVFDALGAVVTLKDAQSDRYVWVSERFAALAGAGVDAIIGRTDHEVLPTADAAVVRAADHQALHAANLIQGAHQLERDGERLHFRTYRLAVTDAQGERRVLGVWIDDTQSRKRDADLQRALEQIEQQQAAYEALRTQQHDTGGRDRSTGLLRREHFEDQLRREVDLSQREHREFALVMIAVDPLDESAAALGDKARARIVETLGRLLRANTRAMDAPCRLAEDRFAVLLSGIGLATAHSRMESLRRQCATQIVAQNGQQLSFSVSMGVASFPHTADSLDSLTEASRTALAEAQRRGGNRVVLASIQLGAAH
jgi:diguanylate cyclase (GGDEF)-like protein